MPRRADIVVLCEDRQQEAFLRRLLRGLGYGAQRVRVRPYPPGEGAAEQRVRESYPEEVRGIRQQKRDQLGLVTMIDADTRTVEHRHRELDTALQASGIPVRQPAERIAVAVPKRNVETWIYLLLGNHAVNEDDDYKGVLGLAGRERDVNPRWTNCWHFGTLRMHCRSHTSLRCIADARS